MFTYKDKIKRPFFQPSRPSLNHIQRTYETRQNQKDKISSYKETIPNRKMTVKRGVFPFAIHGNVVSKPSTSTNHKSFTHNNINKDLPLATNNAPKQSNEAQNVRRNLPEFPQRQFLQSEVQQPTPNILLAPLIMNPTFSKSSNTTEMNKNILLNQYLNQQYDAVVNDKNNPNKKPKYIDFDKDEAFEICAYNKVGEVINDSLINTAINNFQYSFDMVSSIQQQLRALYVERKTETNDVAENRCTFKGKNNPMVTTVPENHPPNPVKPRNIIHKSKLANIQTTTIEDENSKKISNSPIKNFLHKGQFEVNDKSKFEFNTKQIIPNKPLPRNSVLSPRKEDSIQFTKGNDNNNCLSPHLHHFKKNNDWNSSTSSSPYCNRDVLKEHHQIRDINRKSDSSIDSFKEVETVFGKKSALRTDELCFDNSRMPEFSAELQKSRNERTEEYNFDIGSYHDFEKDLRKKSANETSKFCLENSNVPIFSKEFKETRNKKTKEGCTNFRMYRNFDTELRRTSATNEPSLFFCDSEVDYSPATPFNDETNNEMTRNNSFTFDSIVAKRDLEPEDEKLLHPIKFLKSTIGCSQARKQKRKRMIKTPNPAYSDSTFCSVNALRPKKKYEAKSSKFNYYKSKNDLRRKTCLFSKLFDR